jgi:hypothetical protein
VALIAWHVLRGPAQREIERGQSEAVIVDEPAMRRNVFGGILPLKEWHVGQIDPMNCGENLSALPRHHTTSRRESLIAHDP